MTICSFLCRFSILCTGRTWVHILIVKCRNSYLLCCKVCSKWGWELWEKQEGDFMVKAKSAFLEVEFCSCVFHKLMSDAVSIQTDSYSTWGTVHSSIWLDTQELKSWYLWKAWNTIKNFEWGEIILCCLGLFWIFFWKQ